MCQDIKKKVREIMKEYAVHNEDYRNLDEKEKEKIRQNTKEYLILRDAVTNYKDRWKVSWVDEKAQDAVMGALQKKFKKTWGAKARLYLKNRMFCFQEEGIYVVNTIKVHKKVSNFHSVQMVSLKTDLGFIYLFLNSSYPIVFTGHFFDRYQGRLELEMDRSQAIFHFLKQSMLNEGFASHIVGQQCFVLLPNGVGLGLAYNNIHIIKTFITLDMTNKYQKESVVKLKELL